MGWVLSFPNAVFLIEGIIGWGSKNPMRIKTAKSRTGPAPRCVFLAGLKMLSNSEAGKPRNFLPFHFLARLNYGPDRHVVATDVFQTQQILVPIDLADLQPILAG